MVASAFRGRSKAPGALKLGPAPQPLRLAAASLLLEPALLRGARGAGGLARRCTASARASRPARRSSASSRLRRCERVSWATARTTGPQRAITRRFCSSVSAADAPTSKLASTREAVTFACWPPGPEERLARTSTSSSGDRYAGADVEHVVSVPRRCGSSAASSPPGASTSATTSARCGSTSRARSAATRRSTASSTCTPRASPTTRRRCPATCSTPRRC